MAKVLKQNKIELTHICPFCTSEILLEQGDVKEHLLCDAPGESAGSYYVAECPACHKHLIGRQLPRGYKTLVK